MAERRSKPPLLSSNKDWPLVGSALPLAPSHPSPSAKALSVSRVTLSGQESMCLGEGGVLSVVSTKLFNMTSFYF